MSLRNEKLSPQGYRIRYGVGVRKWFKNQTARLMRRDGKKIETQQTDEPTQLPNRQNGWAD